MKFSNLSKEELIDLQKEYRKGNIKESEIPEDVLKDLKELYHWQIEFLKNSIEKDKQEILQIR